MVDIVDLNAIKAERDRLEAEARASNIPENDVSDDEIAAGEVNNWVRGLTSLEKFDEHFFVIRDYFGKCRIGWEDVTINSRTKVKSYTPCTKDLADFYKAYIDKTYWLSDDNGTVKKKQLAPEWFATTKKRYSKIVFKDPKLVTPDEYNLYRGFSVEPKEGDVTLFRELVEELACPGDKVLAEYVYDLFMSGINNPFMPWDVYVICYSKEEGTGKDTLINMYSDLFVDAFATTNPDRIFGRFNEQIAWKPFVGLTEGGEIPMSKLRGMVTSPTMDIEGKGLKGGNIENIMKLMISTNSDTCAKISLTDRRTLALEFPDKRRGDKAYWDRLYKWYYEEGGMSNVLWFLKERIKDSGKSDFKPHPRPITRLLQRMQDKSLPDEGKAMFGMLESGYLPKTYNMTVGKKRVKVRRLSTTDFREHFQESYPGIQKISDNLIADLFKGIGCTSKKTESGNVWELPPLEKSREAWDQKKNCKTEWDASVQSWWDGGSVDAEGNIKQDKDATVTSMNDSQPGKLDGENDNAQESYDMPSGDDIEIKF